nr:lipase 4 [Quercus suber]
MASYQPPSRLLDMVFTNHGKPPEIRRLLNDLAKRVRSGVDCAVSVGDHTYQFVGKALEPVVGLLSAEDEERQLLGLRFDCAAELETYLEIATKLDELDHNEEWRNEDESPEYNFELVRDNMRQLQEARENCDFEQMSHLLRTALTRDLGGMGNVTLYGHSYVGTKKLIERYIEVVEETLLAIVEECRQGTNPAMDPGKMHDEMKKTRQAFGRTALLLSGGGTLGMKHIGVVKTLLDLKLLPRIISGTSAGSIVAAVACVKKDHEMTEELASMCSGSLDVFEKTGEERTAGEHAIHLFQNWYLYDMANLERVMQELLGNTTFQQAYSRTRRILNITVSGLGQFAQSRLLNYMTAPDVVIWSAVAASCSVPGIFKPAQLFILEPETGEIKPWGAPGHKWIDGSVTADVPIKRLSEMLNVNHFVVSQTNAHIVPLCMKEEDDAEPNAAKPSSMFAMASRIAATCVTNAHRELCHRLDVLAEMGLRSQVSDMVRGALSQKYTGDITILPDIEVSELSKILKNPTEDFMLHAKAAGERATWPKLSRIKNHLTQELCIDEAVHNLAELTHFSPSQADIRLKLYARPIKPSLSRRGGSNRSHRSARSTIVPRDLPYQSSTRRPAQSMPQSPLLNPKFPADAMELDHTGSEDSADSARFNGRNGFDENDDPITDNTLDSPPSSEPDHYPWYSSLGAYVSAPATPSAHGRLSFMTPATSLHAKRPGSPLKSSEVLSPTEPQHSWNLKQGLTRKLSKLNLPSAFDVAGIRRNHQMAAQIEKNQRVPLRVDALGHRAREI